MEICEGSDHKSDFYPRRIRQIQKVLLEGVQPGFFPHFPNFDNVFFSS